MSQRIEDYAVIGDRHTAALVGLDGSIDWLCLPRFDSAACFAALLGTTDNGRWLLAPAEPYSSRRRYLGETHVLETTHECDSGTVRVTDLMPTGDGRADVIRRVTCVRGTVRMRHEWVVRTDYGLLRPWMNRRTHEGDHVIVATAGPDMWVLSGDRLPTASGDRHCDEFDVHAGDTFTFSMTWLPSWEDLPGQVDPDAALARTKADDEAWLATCTLDLPRKSLVRRSLLTLRLLTHEQSGGIVAAPTTSLPEDFGGERNWDYRFCWLRDAALTVEALLGAGFATEARYWRDWLLRAVAGSPADLQIMYAVDGARRIPESELEHLSGYADSRPVRIGNAAVDQQQTDVVGEVMIALHDSRCAGLSETESTWALQCALMDELVSHWDEPDHGLWEIRGPLRKFTHSRVMVWAALDRAIRGVEEFGLSGPVDLWRRVREEVRTDVLNNGVDHSRGTFVQHYEGSEVDASLLMIPLVGFLPADDPLVLGTIAAIEQDLMCDGLLLRYRTESGVDGLAGDEHPFLACSFWLVAAYAGAGRVDDARRLFERVCDLANDVGLLSEEYDVSSGRMAGNFPQAFSHLTLVQAALALGRADGSVPPVG